MTTRAVDPTKEPDPAQLEELVRSAGVYFTVEPLRWAAESALYWAALGDLPKQWFPELDPVPYEPLLALFHRGGAYSRSSGAIELGYGTFPIGKVAELAELEPLPIDEPTLDALDAEQREL